MIYRKEFIENPKSGFNYDTNIGRCYYSLNGEWLQSRKIVAVEWWLKEIEVPNDEEIEKGLDTDSEPEMNFIQGAQWMRGRLLAATPK